MKISFLTGCGTLLCILLAAPVCAATLPSVAFTSNVTDGDLPLSVLFIDETANTPVSWMWSFGDGGTSTLQNPAHTYSTAGTYTVTLTASNAAGSATDTEAGYITVTKTGAAPVAAFVANQTTGTVPLSVQFMDASTNTPASWLWSFGDGAFATGQNPVHTYSSAGTYSVTLTVTNEKGATTISQTGYITVTKEAAVPAASFTATGSSGGVPLTVQFVDTSTRSPTSWVWSFGDGSYSTEQNPAHTYSTAGTYTVTLTASNAAGSDTTVESDYITVDPAEPIAAFAADVTAGTAPLAVNFTDLSTNTPTGWYWSFGDGSTSSDQNVIHTYESLGTYTVTLTASNSAGSNTTIGSGMITVREAVSSPSASFTADITSGSAPLVVQFTDTSANTPTAWVWTFGDGESSTLPNPTHTYAAAGSYTVKLTASNSAGTNTAIRDGYITVADGSRSATDTPLTETATPEPQTMDTAVPSSSGTAASQNGGSGSLLPYAGIAVLAVIGIAGYLLSKRPPRGPRPTCGRDL